MADSHRPGTLVFRSLGEGAVTVSLREGADTGCGRHSWLPFVRHLEAVSFPGFLEAAAGINTATVYYEPYLLYLGLDRLVAAWPELSRLSPEHLQEVVCRLLELEWGRTAEAAEVPSRIVEIPVMYGGVWGPDLADAAALCGLTAEEWIRLHNGVEYRVLMIGFVPGFPYLEGLPEKLRADRLPTPRLQVPAGSVAVGGGQTGIYPLESPGGWRVVGRTPLSLFRPDREEPSLLRAGDRVRFVPMEAGSWPEA